MAEEDNSNFDSFTISNTGTYCYEKYTISQKEIKEKYDKEIESKKKELKEGEVLNMSELEVVAPDTVIEVNSIEENMNKLNLDESSIGFGNGSPALLFSFIFTVFFNHFKNTKSDIILSKRLYEKALFNAVLNYVKFKRNDPENIDELNSFHNFIMKYTNLDMDDVATAKFSFSEGTDEEQNTKLVIQSIIKYLDSKISREEDKNISFIFSNFVIEDFCIFYLNGKYNIRDPSQEKQVNNISKETLQDFLLKKYEEVGVYGEQYSTINCTVFPKNGYILDDKIKIFNYLDYKSSFKFFKEKVETFDVDLTALGNSTISALHNFDTQPWHECIQTMDVCDSGPIPLSEISPQMIPPEAFDHLSQLPHGHPMRRESPEPVSPPTMINLSDGIGALPISDGIEALPISDDPPKLVSTKEELVVKDDDSKKKRKLSYEDLDKREVKYKKYFVDHPWLFKTQNFIDYINKIEDSIDLEKEDLKLLVKYHSEFFEKEYFKISKKKEDVNYTSLMKSLNSNIRLIEHTLKNRENINYLKKWFSGDVIALENQSYREILFYLKNKCKYDSDLLNCYDNLIYIYCNKYKELGISFKEYVQLDIVKKQLNKDDIKFASYIASYSKDIKIDEDDKTRMFRKFINFIKTRDQTWYSDRSDRRAESRNSSTGINIEDYLARGGFMRFGSSPTPEEILKRLDDDSTNDLKEDEKII